MALRRTQSRPRLLLIFVHSLGQGVYLACELRSTFKPLCFLTLVPSGVKAPCSSVVRRLLTLCLGDDPEHFRREQRAAQRSRNNEATRTRPALEGGVRYALVESLAANDVSH